jgi:cephalosporin-C deacetylase
MPEVDIENIYCYGGSQGGALSTVCASLEPRVKRAAILEPFLSDYKRTWEMDLYKQAYEELNIYFRMFDPRHENEDEIFHKLGYIDIQYLAPRIKADVLFFTGLMDVVCPPSTQFAAYNKITSNKKMLIYPDFGHEGLPESEELVMEFFS